MLIFILSDPVKQCSNVTVEDVENGYWKCDLLEKDKNDDNDAKICVVRSLECEDRRRMDCKLICLQNNSTHAGWYYQVKN